MEPDSRDLLHSALQALTSQIPPLVPDPAALRLLGFVRAAINEVLHRETGGAAAREALADALSRQITQGESLLAARTGGSDAPDTWPPRPAALMPQGEPARTIETRWNRLAALTARLLPLRAQADAPIDWRRDVDDWLRAVTVLEAEGKVQPASPISATGEDADAALQRFTAHTGYFRDRLRGGAGFAITAVKQLSGGYSNGSFRLRTRDDRGTTHDIVVRVTRENGIMYPYVAALDEELPFIELVRAHGVPAPRPLWLETDTTLLGAPFMVTEFVPGTMIGNSLRADAPLSDALIRNYAKALARLHAVPWQAHANNLSPRIAPAPVRSVTAAEELMLERLRQYLDAAWMSPSPTTLLLFDWLRRHRPRSDEPPVLTHGDLGFHNWLFVGNEPAALLDWETVALSSPSKDLANVRDVVIAAERWPYFLACYMAAGGRAPAEDEMRYYTVLRWLHAVICTSVAAEKMFTAVDPRNIEFLEIGIFARSYFFETLRNATAELLD